MRPVRTRLTAAVVVPLLLLGLSGCGDDPEPTRAATGADPASASPSIDASPADSPTAESTDVPADDDDASAEGTGALSKAEALDLLGRMQRAMAAKKSAHVAMNLGVASAQGDLSFASGSPAMNLVMNMAAVGATKMTMRYVDGAMYVSMPPATPPGKFFRLDRANQAMGAVLEQMKNMTPDTNAAMMRKSLKKMTDLGSEKVGKDDTTHYRVVVDTKASLQALGGALPQGTAANLPPTIEYDMWVARGDLMRRVSNFASAAAVQVDYTEWGKPVAIEAPPASDIVAAPPGM